MQISTNVAIINSDGTMGAIAVFRDQHVGVLKITATSDGAGDLDFRCSGMLGILHKIVVRPTTPAVGVFTMDVKDVNTGITLTQDTGIDHNVAQDLFDNLLATEEFWVSGALEIECEGVAFGMEIQFVLMVSNQPIHGSA